MNSKSLKNAAMLVAASFMLGRCATIPIESVEPTSTGTYAASEHDATEPTGTESIGSAPVALVENASNQPGETVSYMDSESNARETDRVGTLPSSEIDLPTAYNVAADEASDVIIVERSDRPDVELSYVDSASYLAVVRPDDYLGKIAIREYKNLAQWRNIYKWNKELIGDNPNVLHPYDELELFKPEREITEVFYNFIIHKAEKGETLWSIAKDWYGDNLAWKLLYSDNEELLSISGGRLINGMELKIRTNLQNLSPDELNISSADTP